MYRLIAGLSLLLACAACSFSEPFGDPEQVFADPDAYAYTDRVVDTIKMRDVEGFIALAHPEILELENPGEPVRAAMDLFPEGRDLTFERYFAENRVGQDEHAGMPIYMSVFDVSDGDGFWQVILAVGEHDGDCCVTTYWKVAPVDTAPSRVHALSLSGKGPVHYVFLALLFIVPIFMLATAAACILNKHVTLKWVWVPAILVGLWGVTFNWSTGAIGHEFFSWDGTQFKFQLLKLHLLGVSVSKFGMFQPWLIAIGSPVGAVLYWLIAVPKAARRRKSELDAALEDDQSASD